MSKRDGIYRPVDELAMRSPASFLLESIWLHQLDKNFLGQRVKFFRRYADDNVSYSQMEQNKTCYSQLDGHIYLY